MIWEMIMMELWEEKERKVNIEGVDMNKEKRREIM